MVPRRYRRKFTNKPTEHIARHRSSRSSTDKIISASRNGENLKRIWSAKPKSQTPRISTSDPPANIPLANSFSFLPYEPKVDLSTRERDDGSAQEDSHVSLNVFHNQGDGSTIANLDWHACKLIIVMTWKL
ncbi:hypothetical protein Salat_0516100, partial [Sesamum alatum]